MGASASKPLVLATGDTKTSTPAGLSSPQKFKLQRAAEVPNASGSGKFKRAAEVPSGSASRNLKDFPLLPPPKRMKTGWDVDPAEIVDLTGDSD